MIEGIRRVSRPGRRIFAGKDGIPKACGGYGISILSTTGDPHGTSAGAWHRRRSALRDLVATDQDRMRRFGGENMSRIGKKPIPIPAGVTVTVEGTHLVVKGPKGEHRQHVPAGLHTSRRTASYRHAAG